MTRDPLIQIASCKTAAEAWRVLEASFSSAVKSRAINTRMALSNTKKGNLSMAEYVGKMRALGEDLQNAGKTIDEDELISYIFAGLDEEYNPVITSLVTRVEPVSIGEAYAQLLSFEQRLELLRAGGDGHSVNLANRGRGGMRGHGNNRAAFNKEADNMDTTTARLQQAVL